jgi:hypothetical protein
VSSGRKFTCLGTGPIYMPRPRLSNLAWTISQHSSSQSKIVYYHPLHFPPWLLELAPRAYLKIRRPLKTRKHSKNIPGHYSYPREDIFANTINIPLLIHRLLYEADVHQAIHDTTSKPKQFDITFIYCTLVLFRALRTYC